MTFEEYRSYINRRTNANFKNRIERTPAKPKYSPGNAPNAACQIEKKDHAKCVVWLTCYRVRKQDPDNGVYKWHIDAIRRAGLIPDDTTADIELVTRQVKVKRKVDEKTVVVLLKP